MRFDVESYEQTVNEGTDMEEVITFHTVYMWDLTTGERIQLGNDLDPHSAGTLIGDEIHKNVS